MSIVDFFGRVHCPSISSHYPQKLGQNLNFCKQNPSKINKKYNKKPLKMSGFYFAFDFLLPFSS
jgi:hypothetical protein